MTGKGSKVRQIATAPQRPRHAPFALSPRRFRLIAQPPSYTATGCMRRTHPALMGVNSQKHHLVWVDASDRMV